MKIVNDLKNIDFFLLQQQGVINQPKHNKKILSILRHKITIELEKIRINIKND